MDGKLFSQDFLLKGISDTPVWKAITATEFDTFKHNLAQIFENLSLDSVVNEANTEAEIIDITQLARFKY